jgi:hypothetical protein
VKTVPTLRVVSKTDTVEQARQLDVELSAEVQVALADVGAVAREGLLAMSVAAGMAVMQTLFDAEVAAVCGPKGRHDAERVAFRHGRENGSVRRGRLTARGSAGAVHRRPARHHRHPREDADQLEPDRVDDLHCPYHQP